MPGMTKERLIALIPVSIRMKIRSTLFEVLGGAHLHNEVKAARQDALAARMESRRLRGLMRLHDYDRLDDAKSGDDGP